MSGVLAMPYATNDRVRIYYEHIGSGPPLLLHHGSIGSGEDWRDFGYVDALTHLIHRIGRTRLYYA
jgi:pimeloyl-ACP methyl ester carboxylesterase